MKKIGRLTLGLVLIFILSACGPKVVTWQEEAKQADGSMLLLTRTIRMGGGSEIGQSAPVAAESIQFTHPKTGKIIVWNSMNDPYRLADPLLIQLEGDRVFVLLMPRSCGDWVSFNKPSPSFVLQVQQEGGVKYEDTSHLPEKYRYMNLIFQPQDEFKLKRLKDQKKLISWGEVDEMNTKHVKDGGSIGVRTIDYSYNFKNCER
jgi:hypothetical protein